ncbi:DUF1932 domain-containing protein [Mycobacterium szulgai]|uniref:Phosphogluconate dehydrogenase NAD-binding putative C-terminal domain-containing protein n=1 Tax=Mycobacterium szulgai TaxID=1787 RepID=A0A1X2DVS4_MYCSZ|nr:DUF1932 domain-containing protein [Mycobacterium szulgai]MCV7079275.1 DUF1932 domain-containing protein [Mycobacterium szulgai]ORW91789.1 hypothetical protein AWC27_09815 [Mycobacterium szulgai]
MTVVTLLHPGSMGAAVGAQAGRSGAIVRWVAAGRSAETGRRAKDADLVECAELAAALDGSDIVVSICPPAHAEDVARLVAESTESAFTGVYLDANAIAPARMQRVAAALPTALLADGAIIGEPPMTPGTTRLYVCGHAERIARLFEGTALEVVTLPGDIGQASALKMAYASYQKASRVLGAVAHALAQRHGVEDHLAREADLLHSRPLADTDAFRAAAARAWRWAPEMREADEALRAAGLPGDMAVGAATALERWTSVKDRDDLDVAAVLALLWKPPPNGEAVR